MYSRAVTVIIAATTAVTDVATAAVTVKAHQCPCQPGLSARFFFALR